MMSEETEIRETETKPAKKKSRTAMGVLALLLGSFGAHKFYQGRYVTGVLFLLFFWTGIPGILATLEGVHILATDEEESVQVPETVQQA